MIELPAFVAYFFHDDFPFDEKAGQRLFKKGEPLERLKEVREALKTVEHWDPGSLERAFTELATSQGQEKPFAWFPVTRFSVSGTSGGPDLIPMLAVLGKDRVLQRMEAFPTRYSA